MRGRARAAAVPALAAAAALAAWAGPAPSLERGEVSIEAGLVPGEATVGDRVLLEITVTAPEGYLARVEGGSIELGDLVLLSHESPPPESDGGQTRTVLRFVLAAFRPGEHEIPPIPVTVVPVEPGAGGEGGAPLELKTEPLTLRVVSVLAGTDSTFRPLKGPMEVARSWRDFLWIGWVVAALALAGLLVAWWRRRRRARSRAPAPEIVLAPDEWAYRELRRLKREDLLARGELKGFYSRLTGILRGYLERRYAFPARDSTTTEILERVRTLEWGGEDESILAAIMTEADLVKFARLVPPVASAEAALDRTYGLVDRTKPRPMPPVLPVGASAEAGAAAADAGGEASGDGNGAGPPAPAPEVPRAP